MHGYVGMLMYGNVWLCMTAVCIAMYGYVQFCMVMYSFLLLCMTMRGYAWLCVAMHASV